MPSTAKEAEKQGWTAVGIPTDEQEAHSLAGFLKERLSIHTTVVPSATEGLFSVWCKSGLV